MTSNRRTCSLVFEILVMGVAPFLAMACSSESEAPGSNDEITDAGGTTSTMGGPTSSTTATSGQVNGNGNGSGNTTASGVGGPSSSTVGSVASGVGSASTTSASSVGGTTTSSSSSGVGGDNGMGTTNAATGTNGSSGGSVPSGDADPSPGCGMADPTECLPCMSNGRPYYVDMPNNYDPNKPYPVIFRYHPLGGSAQGARNMYLGPNDFEAIYVSPEGSENGFPNRNGVDEQMTRDIMTDIEARLCVDRARYYATGFSYGGSMSYTAACNMSDKFRAVAAMAGATVSGANCTRQAPERPVAVLGIHGEKDTVLPITMAEPYIQAFLAKNGCSGDAPQPSDIIDSECVKMESALDAGAYQGCMEGYPVIWCPIPGYPHNIPMWSRGAIAKFFALF